MPEVCLANDIPEEIGYLCSQREMGMSFVVGHSEIGYMCWQVEFCMSNMTGPAYNSFCIFCVL